MAKPKAKIISIEAASEKPFSAMERVEKYLNTKYEFKFNEVSGKLIFKTKEEKIFQPVLDYNLNSIIRELSMAGISYGLTSLRNLLMSDFTPVFNPFKEYLNKLPEWDGTDYILQLTETVTTTDAKLWQFCFRKWLAAMIASLMHDPIVNHTVIVFSGKQGIGKSSFLINLIPPE